MEFADVKNDIAFRKIFGNDNKKIILISFLNAVMKLKGREAIVTVEILNPYQLPIIKNLKSSIIDVKARDKKGKTYIIEMQVAEPHGLDKRLLYYASKEYAQQIESGEQYTQLKPVIFIGIFDFKFTEGGKYLAHHAVCDVENGERTIKDMDFYFIELPKFNKPLSELTEITDKWIYFIKEAKTLHLIPDDVDDEGLKTAYQDANKHTWTKEELAAYDYAAMREQDERGIIELAEKRAEIRTEKRSKIEVAKKMKSEGFDDAMIIRLTGLTEEDIEDI
jgi:predicted transposase/invertase (TIGR01784 family)